MEEIEQIEQPPIPDDVSELDQYEVNKESNQQHGKNNSKRQDFKRWHVCKSSINSRKSAERHWKAHKRSTHKEERQYFKNGLIQGTISGNESYRNRKYIYR